MTTSQPSREERLLESLLSGGIEPQDAEVLRAFAASGRLREEWEELHLIKKKLEGEERERDEILANLASSPEGVPQEHKQLEDELLDSFRNIAQTQGVPAKPRATTRSLPVRPWWVLAAAAVLLAMIWVPWSDVSRLWRADGPPQHLGPDTEITVISPRGAVESYGEFSWEPPGVAVVGYSLTIFEVEDSGAVEVVLRVPKISGTEYTLARDLPARIRWEVLGWGPNEAVVARGEAEASLK